MGKEPVNLLNKKFLYISPDEAHELSMDLAEKVEDSGYEPDVLVGILSGGCYPTKDMYDNLGRSTEITTIRVKHYEPGKVDGVLDTPMLSQPCQVDVKGKKVLVVDDVSDSAGSLKVAEEHMKERGAKEVRTAVLHYKLRFEESNFIPDFYAREVESDVWVLYPWEHKEIVKDLVDNIDYTNEEKRIILQRTGIPEKWLKRILKRCGYDMMLQPIKV